ncbi:MAG: CRISPR system Cmr subunit Cmr6 [Methanoregulaceae archaeon PtaB.Bin009]|nr:MAG: CRISPR system Cmr subunit Cmr6 [Methanoregulaceae archaeon PtaB.Bin009]
MVGQPGEKTLPGCANAALVMGRYLEVPVQDDHKMHPNARKNLFRAMKESLGRSQEIYIAAYLRYTGEIKPVTTSGDFTTCGRIIIGLGGENVLETGLTLHHTYGTPLIPGTALKGLASHYCDQVLGDKDKEYKTGGLYHEALFGTTDYSGHIIFHDAWITPSTMPESLQLDVMTPHHGDYYSGKGAPTDCDDPVPITFLSVAGTFHIAVSCDNPEDEDGKKWAAFVFGLLSEALEHWGIGGKTSSGYGRLKRLENVPVPGMGRDGDQVMVAAITGAPANQPRYVRGNIILVTRQEDPRGRDRLYFVADDGIGGFIKSDRLAHLQIGEQTRLKITSILTPPTYVFDDPEQHPPQNTGKKQ